MKTPFLAVSEATITRRFPTNSARISEKAMIREDATGWHCGGEMYLRIMYDLSWPMSSASLLWSSKADARLASTMLERRLSKFLRCPALRASNSSLITSTTVSHWTDIGSTHRAISLVGQKKIEFASHEPNVRNLDAWSLQRE